MEDLRNRMERRLEGMVMAEMSCVAGPMAANWKKLRQDFGSHLTSGLHMMGGFS